MIVRHCTEASNVNEELIVQDPTNIRHVTINAKQIDSMSGKVDPRTHLNLDFPDHRVVDCVVAEKLEVGAAVRFENDGLVFARVDPSSYSSLGPVDYTGRLLDMIDAVKKLREQEQNKRNGNLT